MRLVSGLGHLMRVITTAGSGFHEDTAWAALCEWRKGAQAFPELSVGHIVHEMIMQTVMQEEAASFRDQLTHMHSCVLAR